MANSTTHFSELLLKHPTGKNKRRALLTERSRWEIVHFHSDHEIAEFPEN